MAEIHEPNPYESPRVPETQSLADATEAKKTIRLVASRRYTVIALYVIAAIWGMLQIVVPEGSPIDVFFSLAFALIATSWCAADCLVRDHRLRGWARIAYFLTWPLASLIYLIATRQWRGIGLWILHAVGLIIINVVATIAALGVLYSLGWIDPNTAEFLYPSDS